MCKNCVQFSLRKSLFSHENSDLRGIAQQSTPRGQGINPQRSRDQAPYIKGSSLRSSNALFCFFVFFVYNDIEFLKFLLNSKNYKSDRAVAILLLLKIERILIQFMMLQIRFYKITNTAYPSSTTQRSAFCRTDFAAYNFKFFT